MFIKLLPTDIPRYWDAIKYSCKVADEVDDKDFLPYTNELLHALLSDSAQCFVRLSDDRMLEGLAITRILFNKQTDERYLYFQSVYSWQYRPEAIWEEDLEFVKRFARQTKCSYIGAISRVKRMQELLTNVGFEETTRVYAIRI